MRALTFFLVMNFCTAATPGAAQTLSNDQLASCLNRGLTAVLSGQSVQQYIEFQAVTQRVVGPGYRSLSASERSHTSRLLQQLLQTELLENRHRFKDPHITVSYAKSSARSTSAHGVEGTIVSAGRSYTFAVNGFFQSASQCQLYGIGIEGVWSMVKFLQDHATFRSFCRQELQDRC